MIPELSFTKPEQVEESKKIFEGLPTQVNIKNKEARMLNRTPILLQCNTLPWARQFAQEREAFLNRSLSHLDLQQSDCLIDLTQGPNSKFFANIFMLLDEFDRKLPKWNYEQSDPMWELLQYQAGNIIKKIIMQGKVSGDFRDWLIAQMQYDEYEHAKEYLIQDKDRLNIFKQSIMSSVQFTDHYAIESECLDYISRLSAWLWLISDNTAKDVYWDMENFEKPLLIDATTRHELLIEDINSELFDSLKLGYITSSFAYQRIEQISEHCIVSFDQSNIKNLKESIAIIRKTISKIKETLEFIIRAGESMIKNKPKVVDKVDGNKRSFKEIIGEIAGPCFGSAKFSYRSENSENTDPVYKKPKFYLPEEDEDSGIVISDDEHENEEHSEQ